MTKFKVIQGHFGHLPSFFNDAKCIFQRDIYVLHTKLSFTSGCCYDEDHSQLYSDDLDIPNQSQTNLVEIENRIDESVLQKMSTGYHKKTA